MDLEKARKRLGNRWPLVGAWIRRRACASLARDGSVAAVRLLAGAVSDEDSTVRETALAELRSLTSQDAIDALCGVWAKSRGAAIGAIVAEKGYVAAKPVNVRVLSALQSKRTELAGENAAAIVPLVAASQDGDKDLAAAAQAALRGLRSQDAIDALCAAWAKSREAALGAIVAEKAYVAAKPVDVRVLSALKAKRAELAGENAAAIVPLVAATRDGDKDIAVAARAALCGLRSQDAIDALCAAWAKSREAALGAIVAEKGYVAEKPVEVRVLSALQSKRVNVAGENAAAIAPLVAALADGSNDIVTTAQAALRGLRSQDAIDALCAAWVKGREEALGAIVAEQGYVAAKPAEVRVLSALQAKRVELVSDEASVVPLLVGAVADPAPAIAQAAHGILHSLAGRDAVDALCRVAIDDPSGVAAKICLETGKRPSDPEEACLFLFVTRQLDTYFQEDFEFQNLRAAYDRAGERARGHVMEVVRSGDRRCLGFFGRRKPLSECSAQEIELAIESGLKHRDWPRLFRAFQEMPLKYGFPLLEHFRSSGWEPETDDLKILYRNAIQESGGQDLARTEPPKATGSVFERWLVEGRTGDLSKLAEGELLERLNKATPPEGVAIVAALATKAAPGSEASRTVQNNAHWLVRLAGYATGLCLTGVGQGSVQDSNYWVRELARSASVLEIWPIRGTPADLESLDAAPREAFAGKLGAVRRVLRLLLAYRVTTPEMEEVVYEAGEFAGEFEEAG